MKQHLALVGAGGKMGMRCTQNLRKSVHYHVSYLEIHPQAKRTPGRARD